MVGEQPPQANMRVLLLGIAQRCCGHTVKITVVSNHKIGYTVLDDMLLYYFLQLREQMRLSISVSNKKTSNVRNNNHQPF